MNNQTIVFATFSFVTGAICGYILGQQLEKKKNEVELKKQEEVFKERLKKQEEVQNEPVEEKSSEVDTPVLVSPGPAKLATEEQPGINYTDYCKKIGELKYAEQTASPTDGDDTELTEEQPDESIKPLEESYEERKERELIEINEQEALYYQKNKDKIKVLGKLPIDDGYPEIHYQEVELLYFLPEGLLADETGKIISEVKETLGETLTKFGWFQNKEESVWVRNNPHQTDYHVTKITESIKDYFNVDAVDDL